MRQNLKAHQTQSYEGCPKCKSQNWQSIELAYLQGTRESTSGHGSQSLFAKRIAPPKRRSTLAVPILWFIGVTVGGLLLVPEILQRLLGESQVGYGMFDAPIHIPAPIIGFLVFLIHSVAAVRYNSSVWAREFAEWQRKRVCRNCCHVSSAPCAGDSR